MSELLCIGVSHKTAPVEVRERLALSEGRAAEFLRDLRGDTDVHEAVGISTCNRMELYLVVGDPVEAESAALTMLASQSAIRPTELASGIFTHRNCDAARHLYRVTSGLDSMVVGEAEVQGQVKRAYEGALAARTTGPLTNRMFKAALATGKRVRSETSIGAGALSLPAVGVTLARELLGDLRGREVVIVGTGETGELAARAMADSGVRTVFVANRRRDRAISLAKRFEGTSVAFDELPRALGRADIIVAATASPHLLLEAEEVADVMRGREGRSLLMIDLAVPRDIDPACAALEGVSLYDIDDLEAVIDRNRSVRRAEARRAEGIVEEEIQHFASWMGTLEVLPTVGALRERGREIADQVLAENAGKWQSLSESDRERLEILAHTVVKRLLHEPTLRMKELRGDRIHARMQLVRELFGLDAAEEGSEAQEATEVAEVRELGTRRQRRPGA